MAPDAQKSLKLENFSSNGDTIKDLNGSTQGDQKLIHRCEKISDSNGKIELKTEPFKPRIMWPDLGAQVAIHLGFLYGLYYLITLKAKFYTYLWCKLKWK